MEFKDRIADAQYEALRGVFLATGKGRRPNLPNNIVLNHRLLVQLFYLREEGAKSWRETESWFLKIYPSAPGNKVKSLLESTHKKYIACDPLDTNQFLDVSVDIDYISSSLSALGITRANIFAEDRSHLKPSHITNRVVVDLDLFRSQERYPKTLVSNFLVPIFASECEHRQVLAAIQNTLKTYAHHRKSGTTNNTTLDAYLELQFLPSEVKAPKDNNAPTQTVHTQTLHHTPEEIETLHQNIIMLKSIIADLQEEKAILIANSNVPVRKTLPQLPTCDCDNKTVRHLKRNIKTLKERVRHVRGEKKMEKERVVRLQKRCSALKNEVSILKGKNSSLKEKVYCSEQEVFKLVSLLEEEKDEKVNLKTNHKNSFSDDVRQTVVSLISEAGVSASKVSNVIQIVSENLFNHTFEQSLPCAQSAINMCDEGFVLSNLQVAESIKDNEFATLHSDGTSRDGKKIVGEQLSLSDGSTLYLGFVPVASEDANTLLDITLNMFKRLALCFNKLTGEDTEVLLRDLLSKIKSTMTDRAAVMKCFGKKFQNYLESDLGIDTQVHFLHCNAHFLLAVSSACDKALAAVEKEEDELLGRDKESKFAIFKNSENATNRVIRLACDCFGPRGDEKNGCRADWSAFCQKSLIPSFRSNRFNCFFEAAAALIFHRQEMLRFFNSGILPATINQKLESVSLDIQDERLMCYLCAIALFFLKVTGPYWQLINSKNVPYFEFFKYVQMLHSCLTAWSSDPKELFNYSFCSVFRDTFPNNTSPFYKAVHDFVSSHDTALISKVLSACCAETLIATERQLSDFLSGGAFSGQIPLGDDARRQLAHCPLTNLIGEGAFGDFDFDCSRRRNASLHNRSSVHVLNRNKTMKYVSSKSVSERRALFSVARKVAPMLRKESRDQELGVKLLQKEKFVLNQQRKVEKEIAEIERNSKLFDSVYENGGPCKTPEDVNILLSTLKSQGKSKTYITTVFKDQIRFQKSVCKKKSLKLGNLDFMVTSLKSILAECSD